MRYASECTANWEAYAFFVCLFVVLPSPRLLSLRLSLSFFLVRILWFLFQWIILASNEVLGEPKRWNSNNIAHGYFEAINFSFQRGWQAMRHIILWPEWRPSDVCDSESCYIICSECFWSEQLLLWIYVAFDRYDVTKSLMKKSIVTTKSFIGFTEFCCCYYSLPSSFCFSDDNIGAI